MTDTQHEPDIQTAAEVIDAETVTGEAAAVGELSWVDPRSLIVGVNIRGEANLDRYFVRDIADRGVREPIPVRRRPPWSSADAGNRTGAHCMDRRRLVVGAVPAAHDPAGLDADGGGELPRGDDGG